MQVTKDMLIKKGPLKITDGPWKDWVLEYQFDEKEEFCSVVKYNKDNKELFRFNVKPIEFIDEPNLDFACAKEIGTIIVDAILGVGKENLPKEQKESALNRELKYITEIPDEFFLNEFNKKEIKRSFNRLTENRKKEIRTIRDRQNCEDATSHCVDFLQKHISNIKISSYSQDKFVENVTKSFDIK